MSKNEKKPKVRRSPLGLTVLGMLGGGPLHPYAIQSLMKAWGKDRVVNVGQRASLYKMIERLRAVGLIAVRKTERDQRFPERTVYELTEVGRRVGREWLTEMLATPRSEFPEFPAALSFLFGLTPAEALAALERRREQLQATLAAHDRERARRSLRRQHLHGHRGRGRQEPANDPPTCEAQSRHADHRHGLLRDACPG